MGCSFRIIPRGFRGVKGLELYVLYFSERYLRLCDKRCVRERLIDELALVWSDLLVTEDVDELPGGCFRSVLCDSI